MAAGIFDSRPSQSARRTGHPLCRRSGEIKNRGHPSNLRQFRVSKLKIDRSFIRDVAANSNDAAIASAIIGMSKSLNLKVLAEGVEDEAQMTFLRAHQCDEIQGYYFSKPLAVDKVAEKLRGDSPTTRARAQAGGQS